MSNKMQNDVLCMVGEASKIVPDLGLGPQGIRSAADRGDLPIAARTVSGVRLMWLSNVRAFAAKRNAAKRRGRS